MLRNLQQGYNEIDQSTSTTRRSCEEVLRQLRAHDTQTHDMSLSETAGIRQKHTSILSHETPDTVMRSQAEA